MSHETSTNGTVNYRYLTYLCFTAIVALGAYIFTTTIHAQDNENARQNSQLADISSNVQKLTESNILLTRIVQEHDAALKLKR